MQIQSKRKFQLKTPMLTTRWRNLHKLQVLPLASRLLHMYRATKKSSGSEDPAGKLQEGHFIQICANMCRQLISQKKWNASRIRLVNI